MVSMSVVADVDAGVSSMMTMMSVVAVAWVSIAMVSVRWLSLTFVDTMVTITI